MIVSSAFLPTQHHLWGVAASIALAVLASYVALDLALRVRGTYGRLRFAWWGAGSVVMGTGIWAMHFIGMLALQLPIRLGFTGGLTLLSWAAAVGASGVALGIASRLAVGPRLLLVGALAMGLGICGMHYIGMAALDMVPPIVWDPVKVVLSALIAVAASAVALLMVMLLAHRESRRRTRSQILASLVMGAAICGMHYTGMAAAQFPVGAVCLSANQLSGPNMLAIVLVTTGIMLLGTLFASIIDARLQSTARRLAHSLQQANTRLETANAELQKQAFADALTGLPNRLLFEDRLDQALARLDRAHHDQAAERLAVFFVDLDGFKPINDSFGHAAGDFILRKAARRLERAARLSDTVARVGGDEFLVLLEHVHDITDCTLVADRILKALTRPFVVFDKQLQIACSIGIVLYPDQGERDKLVAHADAAMYVAKRAGGGGYALFESHMGADVSNQLTLQSDLRQAIDAGQFELYYQPKIDGRRDQISGVEALIRWNHPERGVLSPALFIGLAERFGLIGRLGAWVIDEACRQIAAWSREGLRMRVAVNISVHQLRENGLAERVEAALRRHNVDASQLLCEITESVAMEDLKATQHAFSGLARIGVYLAIDDFGTGYSSLSYLRQLPAQQLKIDRSFVNDLEVKDDARAVVEAVIRLAHALGLRVVAEGVETAGQRDILLELDCDELQGYFYAKPMQAHVLLEWSQGVKPDHAVDFAPSTIEG